MEGDGRREKDQVQKHINEQHCVMRINDEMGR